MRENAFQIIADALLAAFGAMARQLNNINKQPLKPASFISGCLIAAFMGVIIFFITDNFQINRSIAYAAAGVSGWIGPKLMDKLGHQVMQAAGIKIEDKKNDDDDDQDFLN